jgi:hypothetical protein
MPRLCVCFGVAFFLLVTGSPGFCQANHLYPPRPCSPATRHIEPVTQTVQVQVPVPCGPAGCGAPTWSPPCSPQTVKVRIDVRVRPAACGTQPSETALTSDPLRPLFGLVAATMATPFRVLETVLPSQAPCPSAGQFRGPVSPWPYSACPSRPAYPYVSPIPWSREFHPFVEGGQGR